MTSRRKNRLRIEEEAVWLYDWASEVKKIASQLQEKGFEVKPILAPTVPEGQERLRFCLHSYNTEREMQEVLSALSNFVFD